MRRFRLFALVLAVSLLVASPAAFASVSSSDLTVSADVLSSTPSKVCHPKKPVTCRAADLSIAIADVAIVSTEATDSRLESQEAVVCMPPRWECRANTLPTDMMKIELPVTISSFEPQEKVVCMPPRWECRTNTLG